MCSVPCSPPPSSCWCCPWFKGVTEDGPLGVPPHELAASALFIGGIGSFFFSLSLYLPQGTARSAWETGLITLPDAIGSPITSGLGVQLAPPGRSGGAAGGVLTTINQIGNSTGIRSS